MYKIEVTATICDKKIRDFVAGACGQDIAHIGTDTGFIITTETEPTFEYLQALEKHIESATPEDLGYTRIRDGGDGIARYFINVKARRIA